MKRIFIMVLAFLCICSSLMASDLDEAMAMYEGRAKIKEIKSLLARGINAFDPGYMDYTPLYYAETVGFLIGAGADVDLKNNRGKSALSLADENGFVDIVALLRTAGAK